MDIMPFIMKMKYEYQNLLALTNVLVDPFVLVTEVGSIPITYTPHDWAQGLEILRLLGLINMLHFGRLVEANTCMKKLLACFHGGYLWLDQPVPVTIELISWISRLPKEGSDPSQNFQGKDNDKRPETKLKKRYNL